jgi:hypothetical protein
MNSHENASQTEERKRPLFVSTRTKIVNNWTKEEDKVLLKKAKEYNYKNWKEVASFLPSRSDIQCSARYKRIRPGIVKGTWTPEEDDNLLNLLRTFGKNWSLISKYMPSRSGKQIRDRYLNTLDPSIKRDKFTKEEDMKIIEAYLKHGPAWSKISNGFKGRTGDMIKNRFYSSLKRKINKKEIVIEDGVVLDIESDNESQEKVDKPEKVVRKKVQSKPVDEKLLNKKHLRPRLSRQVKTIIKNEDNQEDECKDEPETGLFSEKTKHKSSSFDHHHNYPAEVTPIEAGMDSYNMDEQINNLIGNIVEHNILNALRRDELEYHLQLLNQLLQLTYAKLDLTKRAEVNEAAMVQPFFNILGSFDRRPLTASTAFPSILMNPLSQLNPLGNQIINVMNNNFNLNYRNIDNNEKK